MNHTRRILAASVAAGAMAWAGAAAAQSAAAKPADESNFEIETVIVTAQKRADNVQDVPISIEVLSGERLEAFQTSDLNALTVLVPNFYFQPSPGNDALFIRGFGSSGANFGFDQSVSLYQDGVYAGRARQFMAPFFDVDRVEVLRGPQGALLGKNTAAGAVSIITANPTSSFEGRVTGSYNFDRKGFDTSGFVSGPITETLSARLAVKYADQDGYLRNLATGDKDPAIDNKLARLTLRYQPSDDVDVIGKFEYSNFRTVGDNGVSSLPTAPIPDVKNDANVFGAPLFDKQQAYNGSLTANFSFGEHTLTSITGYSDLSATRSVNAGHENPAIFHNEYFEDFDQFSQEVRLLSPTGGRLEYIVGAYYDTSDYDVLAPTLFRIAALGANGRINIDFRQKATTWSAFGAGTFHATDDLRILASLRYTENEKSASFVETLVSGTTHPAIGTPRAFAKEISEDGFDPSVTIQYDLSDDTMVYAGFGRGSKGGGYVAAVRTTVLSNFAFRGERSTNYEAGVKSTWLDGRLIANLTAFRTEFKDLQVSAYSPALATTVTTNAAKAHSSGVEGSLTWRPLRPLLLSSSFAYLKSRYDDYAGAPCTAIQPATCTPATNNQKGFPLLSTPKWSGNVRAEYSTPVSDALKLEVTWVTSFKSSYVIATDYSPVYGRQEGWAKHDLRVQLGDVDDRWNVALVGTNLSDEKTVPFAFAWPGIFAGTGAHIVRYVDEPRTVSVEATVRF